MNLERWLQLRREGRLSAMPLGMRVAMASCGDTAVPFDMFSDGFRALNGDGDGNGFIAVDGVGYGYGYGDEIGNGHGGGDGYVDGQGGGFIILHGNKKVYNNGNIINIRIITQRFHEANP